MWTPAYPASGMTPWLRSFEGRSGTRCYRLRPLRDPTIRFSLTPDRRHCARSGIRRLQPTFNLQCTNLSKIQNCQVWWLQPGLLLPLSDSSFTLLLSIPVLLVYLDQLWAWQRPVAAWRCGFCRADSRRGMFLFLYCARRAKARAKRYAARRAWHAANDYWQDSCV